MEVEGFGATGLITYMRTDSLRISEEARQEGNAFIEANYGKQYLPEKPRYFKTKASAQDGHEAIRPTVPAITPEIAKKSLTPEQFKLYSLIWKRFMASLMSNCIQDTVKIEIKAVGESDKTPTDIARLMRAVIRFVLTVIHAFTKPQQMRTRTRASSPKSRRAMH